MVMALAVGALALAAMMQRAGLSLDWTSPGAAAFALALASLGGLRWKLRDARSRPGCAIRDMAEYFALFTLISLLGALASYPVAAFSRGFIDASLYRADLALHFDWVAWYRVVAAHPALQLASRTAYALIYVSPAVLLGYLAIAGRRREAYDFIAAVALAAVMTLAVFRFAPAVGPFGYLWHGPIPYLPVSDLWQPDLIPQLRDHASAPIDPGHLVGLVSVPSFHAAAAVLLIACALPHRPVRWPLVAANTAMLLSTPVEGTHYLVDIIAGAVIAAAALAAVAWVRNLAGVQPHGGPLRQGPLADVRMQRIGEAPR